MVHIIVAREGNCKKYKSPTENTNVGLAKTCGNLLIFSRDWKLYHQGGMLYYHIDMHAHLYLLRIFLIPFKLQEMLPLQRYASNKGFVKKE